MNKKLGDFLAGFELCGIRLSNGTLASEGTVIDEWPEEIEIFGNTYTLEEIIHSGGNHEIAQYV